MSDRPRYAYENPADLAWGAQQVRTWLKRRRLRLAAEHTSVGVAEHDAPGGGTDAAA
ncbi:hypothetical protein AB0F44_01115 [Nocardioides sp. NPDC023903]|uniref:hypothetical protein n=1 Tax=Nocardioides sp. NPDC023903 TaxID=3157195 RepID=UPI0033F7FEAF